jgi:hypothetical protein
VNAALKVNDVGGLFKLVMVISPSLREEEWSRFLANVLDVQYSSATYSGDVPSPHPSFRGINIVLRSIPFLQ